MGDCLLSLNFLNELSKLNNIKCEFACELDFHSQLKELKNTNVILTNEIKRNSIDLWGSTVLYRVQTRRNSEFNIFCKNHPNLLNVNAMTFEIANQICIENNWTNPFDDYNDVSLDFPILGPESMIRSFDYLLVNSYPLSGQLKISNNEIDSSFANLIVKIKKEGKTFITTQKLLTHPSTRDYNMNLAQIGQLSKQCKNIIGIPTSAFWICLNKWALESCERIINFSHDSCHFEFDREIEFVGNLNEIKI